MDAQMPDFYIVEKLDGPRERVHHFRGDIGDEESVNELFSYALEKWGCLDILINNAGAMRINKPLTETAGFRMDERDQHEYKWNFLLQSGGG